MFNLSSAKLYSSKDILSLYQNAELPSILYCDEETSTLSLATSYVPIKTKATNYHKDKSLLEIDNNVGLSYKNIKSGVTTDRLCDLET